ncbi:MAG: lipopolysaccharide heptosyltransferase II [Pseudohongiellaceae bacterium]|nr:lipopolysaccharide heptosyltransferase II [Pseudohongiellaceae bacterium]
MTKKILIVGPSWVGDMVMAQSLFIALEQRAMEKGETVAIDVIAPAWSRPILERMPQVNEAIDLPFGHGELNISGRYRLGKSLREHAYDQVIVLPNSFKSALLPRFTNAPTRTGWRGEKRGWLLNDVRDLNKEALPLMVQRFVALAYGDGETLPAQMPRPSLISDAGSVAQARQKHGLDLSRPVLVICPGAEFGDAKQWPAEHYAALCEQKIHDGWQVWAMGSAKDREVTQAIADGLGSSEHWHDLAGETTLADAIDLISCASAVVSNDSGLMHVAAALGRPIVALYGSTSSDFTPPLTDKVQLLSVDIDCRPCFKRVCPLEHKRCLVDLAPQKALEALDLLLGSDPKTVAVGEQAR